MQGELSFFILSALLIGFNLALGLFFIFSGFSTKPFRLFFALECFMMVLQDTINLFEPTVSMYLGGKDLSVFLIVKDLALIPLCYIEVESLVRQDLQKYPWSERFKKLLAHEIPFIVLMVMAFMWPGPMVTLLVYWFALGYTLACGIILHGMIMTYERQMSKFFGHKSAYSLRWIYIVMVLLIAYAVLYIGFSMNEMRGNIMYTFMYSPCVVIINLTHAYFIEKQRVPTQMIARPQKDVDSLGF